MKKGELPALTGLRALATIGIFLFHSGLLPQGTFPVTLFFMLSGFLIFYKNYESNQFANYREWLSKYALRKVKSFYPLHFVTFIAAIFIGHIIQKGITLSVIISGTLNLLLLQSWYKPYTLGFNGLSWYLSVAIFLYIIAYFLLKFVKSISPHKTHRVLCATLILICGLNLFSRFIPSLYLYTNPLYRTLDCLLGMLTAKIYLERDCPFSKYNLVELIIVLLFIFQYILILFIGGTPGYFSIIFALALYVFAIGKGKISGILCNRLFKVISYYSFEFYMIHELILRIFRHIFTDESMFYPLRCVLIAVPALIVSVILAVAWKTIINKERLSK